MSYWNLLNFPLSIIQNAFNAFMQDKQNKHNENLVDMQNKAAEKQAEKAYIRSLPSNQMQNMRSAGISDFAAAQAISDGGTYQPAPVNTSQGQAPQIDLNGAMQAVLSSAQLKEQKRQFDLQHAEQKRQFDLTHGETKRVNDANINNLIKQGNVLDKTARKLGFEADIAETNKEILNLTKQDYIDATNAENLAKKVRSENQKYIEDIRSKGLQNISADVLKQLITNITERETIATTLEIFGVYIKEKGFEAGKKFLIESFEQSLVKGSPITNAIL